MRLIITETGKFQQDIKRCKKRGKNLEKLGAVVRLLENQTPLPPKLKNHRLKGNWYGRWECHLEPDWLLIYQLNSNEVVLERTGSHADVF